MKVDYFPGCTLKNQAKELDIYGRDSLKALGVEVLEIPEWQCCGGVYPIARDEIATRLSSIRALDYSKHSTGTLLTLCSACHNVIKRVNDDMKEDKDINFRANNYLGLEEKYNGETRVLHYLELLKEIGFEIIKKQIKNPINRRIGGYYGCLLLRPSKVMAFDNPENPTILEDFIKAIGGTPVSYPFRNECCGAYVSLKNENITKEKVNKIFRSAEVNGVEEIVTACPLCYYNLVKNGEGKIKVTYFTELLAEALGVKE